MDKQEIQIESSRRGVPRVNFDPNVWIPCPPVFPAGMDIDGWAAEYGRVFSEVAGPRQNQKTADHLAGILKFMHGSLYAQMGRAGMHLALIHMPNPTIAPVPVCISAWQQGDERAARLRALAGADEVDALEPPVIEEFSTRKLGQGLRVLCQLETTMLLSYAFRLDAVETDVRIFANCDDPARMQRLLPDADELVRQTSVADRAALAG